jgi:hypothetical protein
MDKVCTLYIYHVISSVGTQNRDFESRASVDLGWARLDVEGELKAERKAV